MATAAATSSREKIKEYTFLWEGKDKSGRLIKGDMRAGGEAVVNSTLRRQGVTVLKIKRMLSNPIIFDGRNLYSTRRMRALGFDYYSVGRKPIISGS